MTSEMLGLYAGVRTQDIKPALKKMQELGLIEFDKVISAWYSPRFLDRQFESDDVTGRVAKHRRSNNDVTVLVTPSSVSVSGSTSKKQSDENFDRFYAAYPLHVGKQAARKSFDREMSRGTDLDTVVAGAERYRDDPNREASFTKHPATWLNHGCWDDDPLPSRNSETPKVTAPKPKTPNLERAQLLGELKHLEKINDTGAYKVEIDEINARLAELEGI